MGSAATAPLPLLLLLALPLAQLQRPTPAPTPTPPPNLTTLASAGANHVLLNATGRAPSVPLAFSVTASGAIVLPIEGKSPATVSSTFTSPSFVGSFGEEGTPKASAAWRVTVDRSAAGDVRVRGTGPVFTVERRVLSQPGRLLVNDTITLAKNGSTIVPVQQRHSATFGSAALSQVRGPNNEYPKECVSESAGMYGNPSVHVSTAEGMGEQPLADDLSIPAAFRSGFVERRCVPGLGLLALDDVFGLHAQAVNAALSTSVANCSLSDPPSVTLQDLQFGMAANRSAGHTVEWAVYATGAGCTTDPYYCFVNAAREDLGVNTLPIAGNGIINAMRWGQRLEPLGYGSGEYCTRPWHHRLF